MCGRYRSRAEKQQIAEEYYARFADAVYFRASYNIAPQTFQPVIRLAKDTGEREVVLMRWGLVPYWSKNGSVSFSTINARAETVATNAAFREPFKYRRCLVPADGFYEWQKIDAKTKQPYAITLKDECLFAFAGLWDCWVNKETGKMLETYTIVTTRANELLNPDGGPKLHDRMPVILAPKDYDRWLAPGNPSHLTVDLLRPYPAEEMKAWKIGPAVGSAKNDSPDLCKPV
ncbi:MAG TPA: SOS response-associated peptidase [Candidatus Bathyarchaeia archaeon]|nr:SOS response-associated peptidase [Candidatus Bathyarchaeia archaeon]